MELTTRQQIVELLKVKPMDAGALSRACGVKQRVIEDHLTHVAKSIGKNFEIIPAFCMECDFKFRDRSRTTKPSRCPKCKSEVIEPARFFVNE